MHELSGSGGADLLGGLLVLGGDAGGPDVDPAVVGAAHHESPVAAEGAPDLRVAIVVPLELGPQREACMACCPSQSILPRRQGHDISSHQAQNRGTAGSCTVVEADAGVIGGDEQLGGVLG